MEKFTVDIDKVLDDFEETEALKIGDSHKISNSSLQISYLMSHNAGSQFNRNEEVSAFENVLQVNEYDGSLNENKICSDDLLLKNTTNDKCSTHLEKPDGCDVENENFVENGMEVSENKVEQKSVSDISCHVSTSEIYSINDNQDTYCSLNVGPDNSAANCKIIECDSSCDTKSVPENVSESHLKKENSPLLAHLSCNSLKLTDSSNELHLVNISAKGINVKNNFQELEGINWNLPTLASEKSHPVSVEGKEKVSQIPINSVAPEDINNFDGLNEQKCNSEMENNSSSSAECSTMSLNAEAGTSELEVKCSSTSNLNCLVNTIVKENKEINDNNQQVPPLVNLQPDIELISDDDSGVSSEESNNSPLFFFNNQILNFTDNHNATINQEKAFADDSDSKAVLESNDIPCTDNSCLKSNVTEKNEFISKNQHINKFIDSENTVNSPSLNKFTGARSKLDGHISENSFPNACSSEKEHQSDLEIIDIKENCTEKDICINQCDGVEMFETSKSNDCDTTAQSCLVPAYTCNIDTDVSSNIISVNDITLKEESFSAGSETEGTCIKNDSFSQRLLRPTTLDIPSRRIVTSEFSGESNTSVVSKSDSIQCVPVIDSMSDETSIHDSNSEQSSAQQTKIGLIKPFWIPDAEAPNCMHCATKFTVIKRRHHCRACGKDYNHFV